MRLKMRRIHLMVAMMALWGCGMETPVDVETPSAQTATRGQASFVALLNQERYAYGLGPVSFDANLTQAAQTHADDMVSRGYFDHRSQDGRTHRDRIEATGFRACSVGEAIANGHTSQESVLAGWLASPPHRAILLERDYTLIGLGRSGNTWVLTAGGRC